MRNDDEEELQRWKESRHPWSSPGTAPVFGNGCGAAGGNPYGCLCQERPANDCYGDDNRPYGSCCDLPDEEVILSSNLKAHLHKLFTAFLSIMSALKSR